MNGKRVLHNLGVICRAWRAAQVVLIVVVLMGAAWPAHVPAQAGDIPAAAPSPDQTPLAELLDEQGRLDLASGFRGSIDAHGWRLVSGPQEAPAFAPLAAEEGYHWSGIFRPPGMDSTVRTEAVVRALAMDDAGNVYAGGDFTSSGGVAANNVAKWDGNAWSALGSGVDGVVHALAVDEAGNVYAGGDFNRAGSAWVNHIAKWNGSAWFTLGNGVNLEVRALAVDNAGNLYAGGVGIGDDRIAKWDGSAWSVLGSEMHDYVSALAVDAAGNLYAGGEFTTVDGVEVNYIAKWDGAAWSALGSGMNGFVRALAVDDAGNLYAGGEFTTAGDAATDAIARWDGSAWSALGSGIGGVYYPRVAALVVDGAGNLYVGGEFASAGGVDTKRIAKWNGSTWSGLGSGMDGGSYPQVNTLAVDGAGNLYAGGGFTTAGDMWVNYIAKWDRSTWSACSAGYGADAAIYALVADGARGLYAGGEFITVGGVRTNHVARWSGSVWSSLGSGTNGVIKTLAVDDAGNLYAGGEFTIAGGVGANHIAKWNGSTWSALGSGTNGVVRALAVDDAGNLYAGGEFTSAGGMGANHIAKWNGSTWSALGSGVNGRVLALLVDGAGSLYAGGGFTTAGGVTANYIAKWDGSAWSALGSGTDGGPVNALAADNAGNLYAGGEFYFAGGAPARFIARWDGTAWFPLGSGADGPVNALAADDAGNLYAGGAFYSVGGVGAAFIAKWNGSAWSALGTGTEGYVYALTVDDTGDLYAGGSFLTAGGKRSARIGRWEPAHELALVTSGNGDGRVTSNPPGIDCGVDCSETYGVGTVVTLTASADFGSDFMGWGGACNGTAGCVVAMDALKAVTAAFTLKTYVGTMTKTGNGSGSVNMTPPGIDCGLGCNAITRTFEHGTMVTLTPMADLGSIFVGWSGACAGTGVCEVTMDGPRQTMATFKLTRNLAVSKVGSGSGTVISSPAGIACGGGTCNAPFTDSAVVTVTASAGAFSYFTGWTGACTGVGQCVVTMDADKAVTATFTLQTFPLTVVKAGTGSGTVASNPAGINCGDTCGALFPASSVVIVTATASTFSDFSGWGGACASAEPCVVTMNAAKAVAATFTLRTFPLTVSRAGVGTGTVTSTPAGINCGNTCNADLGGGTVVTLTATPDSGASFSSWNGACSGTGPCVFTVDAAKAVTATFGVPGAVTPQASTMYYGQQLQIEGEAVAAAPAAVTKLVVFTGTVPAGIFLVGVEGSEPYAGEVSAGRLINRLLAEGCGAHGPCTAVNVAVYAPDGTHTDFVATSAVTTDHVYLPHVRR